MLSDDLRAASHAAMDARTAIDRAARLAVAVLTPHGDEFAEKWAREFLEEYAPEQIPSSRATEQRQKKDTDRA